MRRKKQFCVNPGSRWGGAIHSRRESDAGRRGPQALDWAAGEHPHLLGAEAVRQRDCAAAAAQVQALQVTTERWTQQLSTEILKDVAL